MGCSTFLYLHLGNPVPTEGKETYVSSGCSLFVVDFGKGLSYFGLGFQLLVCATEEIHFVPLSDTAFDPHSRENTCLIHGVCMLADVQEIKRITGRTFT